MVNKREIDFKLGHSNWMCNYRINFLLQIAFTKRLLMPEFVEELELREWGEFGNICPRRYTMFAITISEHRFTELSEYLYTVTFNIVWSIT